MSSNKCAWCLASLSTRSPLQTDRRGIWRQREVLLRHGTEIDFSRCFPALMAAIAAVTLKRPVRFVLTREVDSSTTGHRCYSYITNHSDKQCESLLLRHEARVNYQLSFNSSGRILKAGFDLSVNAGCSSDLSVTWVDTLLK